MANMSEKKTKVELEFLTDVEMLLITIKGTGCGTCHMIDGNTKANSKSMKDFDTNKE